MRPPLTKICIHCQRPIELKNLVNSKGEIFHEWWSHIGGATYCQSTKAAPAADAGEGK